MRMKEVTPSSMDASSDVGALLSAGRGWPVVLMLVPEEPSSFEFRIYAITPQRKSFMSNPSSLHWRCVVRSGRDATNQLQSKSPAE